MKYELHKEELKNIVTLFESLAQDSYKFSDETPSTAQYHKGTFDAYNNETVRAARRGQFGAPGASGAPATTNPNSTRDTSRY